MRHFALTLVIGYLFLPSLVSASVTINEVAWMGDLVSANHEWIELYNSGYSAFSLSGFTLSDGMNLAINLEGEIGANQYAVLERTSDESASGLAWLIYTGALVNTGATLQLRDAQGQTVDQVAGGENWEGIGGDNLTKETAQYTTSGWVTDTPTPGSKNNSGQAEAVPEAEENVTATKTKSPSGTSGVVTKSKSNSSGQTVLLRNADSELSLSVSGQTVAYVNQPISFTVTPSGIGDTISASLVYTWNFGDTYTAIGTKANHQYNYPGTYVVTVVGKYAKHNQVARHEITVLPVTVSLTRNEAGDIQLHNNAPYDIDVSGYRLAGIKTVELPPLSIILPKGTITVASKRLEDKPRGSLVALYDNTRSLITSLPYTIGRDREFIPRVMAEAPAPVTNQPPTGEVSLVPTTPVVAVTSLTENFQLATTVDPLVLGQIKQREEATPDSNKSKNWRSYGAFLALLLFAVFVIMILPREPKALSSPIV